jgi:hypothetical protein
MWITAPEEDRTMSATVDLKELERRAYRSFFQDGLWDIFLGLLLLQMGLGPALLPAKGAPPTVVTIAVPLAVAGAALAIFFGGKRLLTIPRLGRVRFGPARQAGRRKTTVVMALSVLVGLLVFALGAVKSVSGLSLGGIPFAALVFAANCLVVFALGAYFLDFSRLYAYGVLYAASFPLAVLLHQRTTFAGGWLIGYGITSGPMLIIGLVLLVRFLRDRPLPATEADSGGAAADRS